MRCVHMRAAGNDFMVIDGREKNLNFPVMARKICVITGADGFMVLDKSETTDFRLHFYNRDGSRASMCGNGSRCICKFAYDIGLVGEKMTVQTDAGVITGARINDSVYRVGLTAPEEIKLQIKPGVDYCFCGVPHAVVEEAELKKEALYGRARTLRNDPIFFQGSNVDFYTRLEAEVVKVLTFERGVEDFTMACGTGCAAVAAVLYAAGQLPGGRLTAINPGGILEMAVDGENGHIRGIHQEGPAETVKTYIIDNDFF